MSSIDGTASETDVVRRAPSRSTRARSVARARAQSPRRALSARADRAHAMSRDRPPVFLPLSARRAAMTRAQTTLSRFIMEQTKDRDMTILMNALQLSCKYITRAVRKAGIAGLYGMAGEVNSTGDDVKKLDILSNEIMVRRLATIDARF